MRFKDNVLANRVLLFGLAMVVAAVMIVGLPPTTLVYASDSNVEWTRVDGTDFADDDIWFYEMFGATNGFPFENQSVNDDSVVGRALTLNKAGSAGRAMGKAFTGIANAGLYKFDFDVNLPSNFGGDPRGAGIAFFESSADLDLNMRRSDTRHVFRILSTDATEVRNGGIYLDFKKNIANVDSNDDSWQIAEANLDGAIAVTGIEPNFTPNLWINVSAVLDYNTNTAIVTLTVLEGANEGYSRTFATDLPGEDNGIGLMAVLGMTKGGGSSWTAKLANIDIHTGAGHLTNFGRIRIDEEPNNIVAIPGRMDDNTRVSVSATGMGVDAPLNYQWYNAEDTTGAGGVAINGATEASYLIPTDTKLGTYYLYCEITVEGADPVTTKTVTITVRIPEGEKQWGTHHTNPSKTLFTRGVFMESNPYFYFNDELQLVYPEKSIVTPILVNGTLLIPYEAAVASFGPDVTWDLSEDSTIITAKRKNTTAVLAVGGSTMEVGSKTETLVATATKIDDVLYLPAEALAKALGLSAGWDITESVLVITNGIFVPVYQGTISHSAMNDQYDTWYGSNESMRLADNLLLFQRNSGGWNKNTDMGVRMSDALRRELLSQKSKTDATLDNGVTIPEIRYLIKVYQATKIERYRDAYMAGINAVLKAQYPNGGFPQIMNQPSSYHGEITYNDNAMTQVLQLWWDVYSNRDSFYSIDTESYAKIEDSLIRGIDVILDSQVYSEQQQMLTAWGAQHDRVTLKPTWGRDYEPPSISGWESIKVIQFLMSLDKDFLISLDQSNTLSEEFTIWERVQNAIHSAVEFFAHVEITGYSHATGTSRWGSDRVLIESEKGRGLWARFIDIETFEPLFFCRRSPSFRGNPREQDTYRPIVTGVLAGKHNTSGGNLRNLYTDSNGNLYPVKAGPGGSIVRPEGAELDIKASYANISHERRNGYQFIGGYGNDLPANYSSWLSKNGLSGN